MSDYEWALFLHILGAVLLFSGMAVAGSGHWAARRRADPREVALLLGLTRVGVVLVGIGTLLVVAFGLWLVDLTGYGYGGEWVVSALALFVVASALGTVGGRQPKRARLLAERLARENAAQSPELRRLLDDRVALVVNSASVLGMVAVLALMVFKPGAG